MSSTLNGEPLRLTLKNGSYSFTTLSNHPDTDVFPPRETRKKSKKWNRIIFLLHGFPDTHKTFKEIWPILEAGLPNSLILAPKMRGYESSSIQEDDSGYRVPEIASDVKQWIMSIKESSSSNKDIPIHLIGHDWGAIVAFRAAHDFPELITSMVTLAIPYVMNLNPLELVWFAPQQVYYSSYMATMQLSYLYYNKLINRDSTYLDGLYKFWSPTWKYRKEDLQEVKKTLSNPSVMNGATAYYRGVARHRKDIKFNSDFTKVPTLILGGEEDGCMHKNLFERQKTKLKDNPDVKVEIVPNAGHFLHREAPKKVGELAIDWFLTYSGK